MTDLKVLKPEKDTVEVILHHPATGEMLTNEDGTEMTITLYAPWTKEYRSAGFSLAQNRLKTHKDDLSDFTFEEMEDANIDLLAKVTVAWDITYDSKKPKLTQAKAREIYDELFWIKGQLEKEINSVGAFTKL